MFPTERYGAAGDQFAPKAYDTDPSEPMEAWEAAKKRAGIEVRFHDLRHTAVSRMLNAGVPIPKVAKIVGWSTSTAVKMAKKYGHFSLDDLRGAVENINSRQLDEVAETSGKEWVEAMVRMAAQYGRMDELRRAMERMEAAKKRGETGTGSPVFPPGIEDDSEASRPN